MIGMKFVNPLNNKIVKLVIMDRNKFIIIYIYSLFPFVFRPCSSFLVQNKFTITYTRTFSSHRKLNNSYIKFMKYIKSNPFIEE